VPASIRAAGNHAGPVIIRAVPARFALSRRCWRYADHVSAAAARGTAILALTGTSDCAVDNAGLAN
jgi:hypothetical protein